MGSLTGLLSVVAFQIIVTLIITFYLWRFWKNANTVLAIRLLAFEFVLYKLAVAFERWLNTLSPYASIYVTEIMVFALFITGASVVFRWQQERKEHEETAKS
ncbi:hypothetical protein [Bdellovibrio reynosensis]|uniref:Uncharacterized protein n=1 Tax=Bdellovibrio reynosensis TaxID=2835041 RepID=A0ABY4CGF8_9BACT|nr:hypothetical protein [Bdellovibrio reynosensis]UOF02761.1 hypothetical protein MNR06_07330 [Bdellovibrio reynosensis]